MKSLQLDSPHAIVVLGIQGSGKSFFASKFAETFNAPYLDEAVFRLAARDEQAGQHLMADVLGELVKTRRSILIEQSFSSRNSRLELVKNLKKAGYIPLFVWVQVDLDTAIIRAQRLYKMTEDEYRQDMRLFSPPHPSEKAVVISGKHTFATQAKAILKRLTVPRPMNPPETRPPAPRGQIIVR